MLINQLINKGDTKMEIVKEVSKVEHPRLRMFSDSILCTANKIKMSKSGIVLNEGKGDMKTRQTVICCGPASGLEPGMEIELNPSRFQREHIPAKYETGPDTYKVLLPIEIVDGIEYLLISTRELKYAYEK
jgi:hypothetical protein